jgi:putative PIN family toxin of toxin-antitoxin system
LFELVTSEHILAELERTLAKDYFRRSIPATSVPGMLARFRKGASVTSISVQVTGIATHPEDDLVLATALSGNAQFLVTGDRQLLKLRDYKGIRIVDSAEFLVMLLST